MSAAEKIKSAADKLELVANNLEEADLSCEEIFNLNKAVILVQDELNRIINECVST